MATQAKKDNTGLIVLGGAVLLGGVYFLVAGGKATIVGVVKKTADGSPIVGALITVGQKTATSEVDGVFIMDGLPTGEVEITITANGFLPNTKTYDLVKGNNPIFFFLSTTVSQAGLAGRVTNVNTGEPLSTVVVTASGRTAHTAADGTYSIPGLAVGVVTVTFVLQPYKSKSQTITLVAGTNTLNMTMNNIGTIQGTVEDSVTHAVISGATVVSGSFQTSTNALGAYSLTMPAGLRTVTIGKAGYQAQSLDITVEAEMTKPLSVDLIPTLTQTGRVQGTITDASNGGTVAQAHIMFQDAAGNPFAVYSGPLGVYSIELPSNSSLGGLAYAVYVEKTGYNLYSGSQGVRTGAIHTKNIALTPVAPTVGELAGIVRKASDQFPIQNALVSLEPGNLEATTDANGYFRIQNVPVGNYTAWASAAGYAQESRAVTITANNQTAVGFDMVPTAQALGFHLQIDFSSYPTAAYWIASFHAPGIDLTSAILGLNPDQMWNAEGNDLGANGASGTMYGYLYDSAMTPIVERAVNCVLRNGHAYSFEIDNFFDPQPMDMGIF